MKLFATYRNKKHFLALAGLHILAPKKGLIPGHMLVVSWLCLTFADLPQKVRLGPQAMEGEYDP